MSVEKEIRKILGEATPAAARAKQELVRSGLGHDKNMAATMAALKDPEEAMKSPAKRELLLKVMQDLLDVVVNDPSMVMKTKTALRKEEVEEIEEKLVGGQKKLDVNKNGKLDAEDFKKLRMKKEEEEKSEEVIEAKMSKKAEKEDEEEDEEEDEDEKEMEDDEKEEEDEVELSKDQVDKMIAAMKKAKGFKAHIKTLQGAEEGFVSHAQRKAVWASRNDAKEAMKRKAKKTAKEEVQIDEMMTPAETYKKIAVKHLRDSMDKNATQKQRAYAKMMNKRALEASKMDNHKDALNHYRGVSESVTTDYSKIAGQSQNKTPTQKLATDYKLATKKTQKEEVQIDELDKSTLGSYVKKAAKEYGRDKQLVGRESPDGTVAKSRPEVKLKLKNRMTGIEKATDRLAKEEVQIDELDKPTVKSYLDKVRFKQARSAVQANMGTPGMKKKHSVELEKTAKSMETAKNRLAKEEVELDEEVKHRVSVTVSDPNHTMVTKRKEQMQKFVRVGGSKESAVDRAKAHYKKQGYKVHDAEHVGTIGEEVQIDEAGPFSYGAKPPKKGSIAYNAAMKRKEQEKNKVPVEPKDQMVGTAKVVKEAFPTVDDAKKRMKDALKSKFEKKKISTGTVYTRKYKEEPEDEKKSDK